MRDIAPEEFADLIAEAAAHKAIAYLIEKLGYRLAMFGGVKTVETELLSSVSDAVSESLIRLHCQYGSGTKGKPKS